MSTDHAINLRAVEDANKCEKFRNEGKLRNNFDPTIGGVRIDLSPPRPPTGVRRKKAWQYVQSSSSRREVNT